MLYWLYQFQDHFSALNVLRYISVRAALAAIISMLFILVLGPMMTRFLVSFQYVEHIRRNHEGLYEKHKDKGKTPTMGGLMILLSVSVALLICTNLNNFYVHIIFLTMLAFGSIGWCDDVLKAKGAEKKGLSVKTKFFAQMMFTIFIGGLIYAHDPDHASLTFPFLKNMSVDLGWMYLVFMFCVILGTCNAVNITDGLDGLATGSLLLSFAAYAILAYVVGHVGWSHYLQITYLPGTGELVVVCASLVGACLGFLWFNSHPASVFMGDTGSLTLGGLLGIIAILIKQELLLICVGGVFVIETMSVIIQVVYYKCTKKRFFLIAPLHHHFEMKGIPESKIVIRFWIMAVIFTIIGLATLKIR